jgi:hypothetical protein
VAFLLSLKARPYEVASRGGVSNPRAIRRRQLLRFRAVFFATTRAAGESEFYRLRQARDATECLCRRASQPSLDQRCAPRPVNAKPLQALRRIAPFRGGFVLRGDKRDPRWMTLNSCGFAGFLRFDDAIVTVRVRSNKTKSPPAGLMQRGAKAYEPVRRARNREDQEITTPVRRADEGYAWKWDLERLPPHPMNVGKTYLL